MNLAPFKNHPFTDFTTPESRRAMLEAIDVVRAQLGKKYDLVIAGSPVQTTATFTSVNPARPAEIVGIHFAAGAEEAHAAVEAAQIAFASWRKIPVEDRAALLIRAASLLRERYYIFCAWLTLEVGKNWAEADADVGECGDFLEF